MPTFKTWDSSRKTIASAIAFLLAFLAMYAIPAEARRHYRSHHHHVFHRHYSHHHYARHARHHRYAHHYGRRHHAQADESGMRSGYAAIVVDANSGHTLYSQNEHELRHPASVTKVMTLYLLFEQLERGRLRLDSPLMISSHAHAQAPSKLGLEPGETIDVENAIKAVVTKSANDIAVAIAENLGGDEETFAQEMTQKDHALGMHRTHFANASGLPNSEQLTTAHDLAILGRAIQDRFPRYYRYFATHSFAYNGAVHRNHNHLLGRIEGVDGIKTGYTRASGFNLLSSVHRDGHHIVAVVLGGRTAGVRDRIMAGLIEAHIDNGSGTRTAAAVTEDNPVARPIEPVRVAQRADSENDAQQPIAKREEAQRDEVAEEDEVAPAPRPARAERAALPTPAAPIPTYDRAAPADKARPAFVPGVQKHAAEPTEHKSHAAARAKTPESVDGSTSHAARSASKQASAAATTPSSLKHTDQNRTQIARAVAGRPLRAGWMIQVGAADDATKANELLSKARSRMHGVTAKAFTEKVQKGGETLYRARFAGLEEDSATLACKELKRSGMSCFATKN
jgi:D-alanyl-D-alanine carboxypeptidase